MENQEKIWELAPKELKRAIMRADFYCSVFFDIMIKIFSVVILAISIVWLSDSIPEYIIKKEDFDNHFGIIFLAIMYVIIEMLILKKFDAWQNKRRAEYVIIMTDNVLSRFAQTLLTREAAKKVEEGLQIHGVIVSEKQKEKIAWINTFWLLKYAPIERKQKLESQMEPLLQWFSRILHVYPSDFGVKI